MYSLGEGGPFSLLKQHKRELKNQEMKRLETLIAKTIFNPKLIKPEKFKSALETRRDIQRENSLVFISDNKS